MESPKSPEKDINLNHSKNNSPEHSNKVLITNNNMELTNENNNNEKNSEKTNIISITATKEKIILSTAYQSPNSTKTTLNLNIFIVGGLLFGDEGKGTTVEFLSHKYKASLVVRYGGGPQAAHHIVLSNGLWHCFSQLGSASFEKSSSTLLSKFMLINPITLIREIEVLSQKGICEAEILSKLFIDQSCFIITPYHKLVNVTKEILRKKANQGSTGLGVGVALDDAMYQDSCGLFPKARICFEKEKQIEAKNRNYAHVKCDCAVIQVKDFYDRNLLFKKLKAHINEKTLHVEFLIQEYYEKNGIDRDFSAEDKFVSEVRSTLEKFKTDFSLVKLLKIYFDWFEKFSARKIFIENSANFILDYVKIANKQKEENSPSNNNNIDNNYTKNKNNYNYNSNIVFEGSQGALLDRIYGFYPHITKTLCSWENAEAIVNEINNITTDNGSIKVETYKVGVLRAYSSRHGKGPFVTESEHWSENVKEMHNDFGRFQGSFRLGPFDLIAARYGLEIFKPHFLSITCVDRIVEKVCKRNFVLEKYNNDTYNIDKDKFINTNKNDFVVFQDC